jgi:hypothetical protein
VAVLRYQPPPEYGVTRWLSNPEGNPAFQYLGLSTIFNT